MLTSASEPSGRPSGVREVCSLGSRALGLKALSSLFSSNRAATNHKVREQVRLELSFVNSDLQMLKEELEGLNISVGVYQSTE